MRKPGLIIILLALLGQPVSAQQVVVSENGEINSVQAGIDQSKAFDTLLVKAGIYLEHDIKIDKPLTIIGEKGAVIDGNRNGHVLMARSNNITIKDIEIRHASSSFMEDYAGILIEDAHQIIVENIKLTNNYFGIYLANSSEVLLKNNNITANGERETSSGNGIHLWYSKNVVIQDNYISGHRDGLYFEFVDSTFIQNNLSENNIRYGIHFMYSDNCIYESNTFRNNGGGVAVMYTSNVKIINNKFEDNWGS